MLKKIAIPFLSIAALLGTTTPGATADIPSREEMWNMLQQQQKEINTLKQQLTEKKNTQAEPTKQTETRDSSSSKSGLHWSDRITFNGAVDVRAKAAKDFNDTSTSDITLNRAHLGMDAKITNMVTGHVMFLHEDPSKPETGAAPIATMDEATITLGDTEQFPLYLTAGRMAVPFGKFNTNLITDSLTLSLAETKETTLQVGFVSNGVYGSLFGFNGNKQKNNSDTIDQFGANLGYSGTIQKVTLDIGASYINSMENSGGLTGTMAGTPNNGTIDKHIGGAGIHAMVEMAGVSLIGEYITALEAFTDTELPWNGIGAKPKAWNLEAGYTFDLMGKQTIASAAWQGTGEALGLTLPERRLKVGLSMEVFEHTTVAMEWMHDKDYATNKVSTTPGTDHTANTGTMKLAVEF